MKSALMLGVNPNAEREKNDFYATNPHALEIAMPILKNILPMPKYVSSIISYGNVLVVKVIYQKY